MAKAKDKDVDFVQVWEEIQVAVNMVNEVGRESEFVPEDGRNQRRLLSMRGLEWVAYGRSKWWSPWLWSRGGGKSKGLLGASGSMRSFLHKSSMHKLAAIMSLPTMHGSTNKFVDE